MKSNNLQSVEQGQLALVRKPGKVIVPEELVFAQPTFKAAINLCISASGLDDKELYMPLGIDAGHWTRIRKGDGHFPPEKLPALMDLCGNDAPLVWLANCRGFGLIRLISETEKMLAERERELEEKNLRISVLEDICYGRNRA